MAEAMATDMSEATGRKKEEFQGIVDGAREAKEAMYEADAQGDKTRENFE
jgi:hypothetical protein